MIDGMNGLCSFTAISICLSISSFIYFYDLAMDIQIVFSLILLLSVFLLFNFPFGKIFLGDAGAYWIGWILGSITIHIFTNDKLNSWSAVLILFYPTMEVIFSTIRKIISRINPFYPDINHLHIKLYFLLKGPFERRPEFNSFTTLCLMPFWIGPPLTIIWIQMNSNFSYIFLLFFSFTYILYYKAIPSIKNH